MKTRTLMCTVVAALALVGCASISPGPIPRGDPFAPGSERTCVFSTCTLYVRVVQVGSTPTVQVEIDKLRMFRQRDPTISWNLVTPGYEFRRSSDDAGPIIFKAPNASTAPQQLRIVAVSANNFRVSNRNTDRNEYGYKVRVYRVGGGPNDFLESDPAIFNDF